jgi:hypothetical protein
MGGRIHILYLDPCSVTVYTVKKENKVLVIYQETQKDRVKSHI